MLKQGLQQKLLQKLSPQQIQFIKLLQLNTTDLEQRVEQELIENPALENTKDDEFSSDITADVAVNEAEPEIRETEDVVADEPESIMEDDLFDLSDYTNNDDYDNDSFHLADETGGEEDRKDMPLAGGATFYDALLEQFTAISNSEHETALGKQIIGTIDEDGYLRRPLDAIINDLLFSANVETTIEELERVLHKIQNLDPAGIAARNLQECLLLATETQRPHPSGSVAGTTDYRTPLRRFYQEALRKIDSSDED
jgi:RNA polymerase sigma-54 factor